MNNIPHHTPLAKRPYEKPVMSLYELQKRPLLLQMSSEDYTFEDSVQEW